MTSYESIMLRLAFIRTVGVVIVVMCWIFTMAHQFGATIYRVYYAAPPL